MKRSHNTDFRRVIAGTYGTRELQSESQLIYQPPCSPDARPRESRGGVRAEQPASDWYEWPILFFRSFFLSPCLSLVPPLLPRSPRVETRADSYESRSRHLIHSADVRHRGFLDD